MADDVAATQRAIRPDAVALALSAALAGVLALAIIGQLLSRQLVLDSAWFAALAVVAEAAVALLLAVAIAAAPGRTAARVRAAASLRTD